MKAVRLVTLVALVVLSVLGLGASALASDGAEQLTGELAFVDEVALPEAEVAADMVMICEIDGSCGFIAAALLEPLAEVASISIEPEATVASASETFELVLPDGLMCEPADGSCFMMTADMLALLAKLDSLEAVAIVASTTEVQSIAAPEGLMCDPFDGLCIPISEIILEGEGAVAAIEQTEVVQPEVAFEQPLYDVDLDPFTY